MSSDNPASLNIPFETGEFLENPSGTIRALDAIGDLARYFPAVASLHGVEQSDIRHTEGDAFVHTLLTMDAVALQSPSDEAFGPITNEQDLLLIFYALLYHDTGKYDRNKDSEVGQPYNHAKKSAEHARKELADYLTNEELEMVVEMIEKHERVLDPKNTSFKLNKLAKLFSLGGDVRRARILLKFAESDILGRRIHSDRLDIAQENANLTHRNIAIYRILLEQLEAGLTFPLQRISRPTVERIKKILAMEG